ncbi:MAG: hypothetical protein GY861_18805 [bacterium]|nr:hypothetical protein [bacterium]
MNIFKRNKDLRDRLREYLKKEMKLKQLVVSETTGDDRMFLVGCLAMLDNLEKFLLEDEVKELKK